MEPTTWPENQQPTAEQWLDWLLSNYRGDQIEIAQRVQKAWDRAHDCFVQDHDSAVEQAATEGQRIKAAYDAGWQDALTKFQEQYSAAREADDA